MSVVERFDVTGRVALVTGAAGRLGASYVRALADAGARVAALDLAWPAGARLPEGVVAIAADITDRAQLERALAETLGAFGRLDVLVNNAALDAPPNAGEQETGPFESYPLASWEAMLRVNLTGMFLSCQVFGGHMAAHGGGSIVNISSIYGIRSPDQRIYRYRAEAGGEPFVKPVAYSVTKSGVLNLTRYLATYWAEAGVRVNTLVLAGVYDGQDATFVANYTAKVPLGRMAAKDEYDGAVLFLASDASSYMTGAELVVDGGYSAW